MERLVRVGDKVIGAIDNGIFTKRIKEGPHLLHNRGGVPSIDAKVYNEHRDTIKEFRISTDAGRTFSISCASFEENKEEIDYGWGKQYVVDREYWNIT